MITGIAGVSTACGDAESLAGSRARACRPADKRSFGSPQQKPKYIRNHGDRDRAPGLGERSLRTRPFWGATLSSLHLHFDLQELHQQVECHNRSTASFDLLLGAEIMYRGVGPAAEDSVDSSGVVAGLHEQRLYGGVKH